jgi:hypothetical protein
MTLWIQNIWNGCLKEVQNGHFLLCPNGSHLAQYDDQKSILKGLYRFFKTWTKALLKRGNSIEKFYFKLSSCRRFLKYLIRLSLLFQNFQNFYFYIQLLQFTLSLILQNDEKLIKVP